MDNKELEIAKNTPIPTLPCFKCGELTNETQSVHGIGHYKCFKSHGYESLDIKIVERQ